MKRNLSDYFVALSVIACSVVLLGALTFALSGYRLKKPTRTLQINYEDVTGIKVNSEVRYAGAPAGRVIAMRHLTAKEREASANKKDAVRVTVSLNDGIPPLPTDITATLSSDTMKKDLGEFTPKLGPLADSLKMDADHLQNMITNLEGVAKGADTVFGSADSFIKTTDKQLSEDLKQLHVTLLNLKVVTTYAKELVGTLAAKPNRVIFSGKPATLTPESEILKSSKPMPARKP